MTYKTRVSYDGYDGLFAHEVTAMVGYMERNDPSELERIIREPPESRLSVRSQGMRDFIADVIVGKKRRSTKPPSTELRDFEIFLNVRDLVDVGVPLKSNLKGDGHTAMSITAKKFFPNQEKEAVVAEAYKRIKKKHFPGLDKLLKEQMAFGKKGKK